jgi:orotate phosphoribosyltransferase
LEYKKPISAFIVRKDQKAHGLQKKIEGPVLKRGMKVVVVEDVITTGSSVLKAIQAIEETGAQVVSVVALVDRGEGGREILSKYHYTPLFSREEVEVE